MASRKTWVWILVGALGVCLVALIAAALSGVYFVTHHIQTERSTSAEAIRALEDRRAAFRDQRPLYELDESEHPRIGRPSGELPTSASRPQSLWLLSWDPDEQRLVKVSLPLWMLSFHKSKMRIIGTESGFSLDRFNLDVDELERIGPALVLDFRNRDGVRVLVWTQ